MRSMTLHILVTRPGNYTWHHLCRMRNLTKGKSGSPGWKSFLCWVGERMRWHKAWGLSRVPAAISVFILVIVYRCMYGFHSVKLSGHCLYKLCFRSLYRIMWTYLCIRKVIHQWCLQEMRARGRAEMVGRTREREQSWWNRSKTHGEENQYNSGGEMHAITEEFSAKTSWDFWCEEQIFQMRATTFSCVKT